MQRLLITIPILVVMLTGCGNAPTDLVGPGPDGGTVVDSDGVPDDGGINDIPDTDGDGTDDSVVLDSDGDGFSDDEETGFIPGTDPFDPTDNPNNVRDTDGDGCSDYDELNFDGFCNNDPNVAAPTTEDFQKATWLVVYASDSSSGIATAFGVGPNLLGTNAHVVEGIKRIIRESNGLAAVVQHETGAIRTVTTVWTHPDYDTGSAIITPDVGLLETDSENPDFLILPTTAPDLQVFDNVRLCGFPGDVTLGIDIVGISTGEFRPRASCLSGVISAIRPFNPGVALTPENSRLIQYDISTEPGVSGSAVFDDRGQVIGIHAFGFSSEGEQNAAIRVDELTRLIDLVSNGSVTGTVLADISKVGGGLSLGCPPLCVATGLCDSDCDGWFDDVEIDILGSDPCDPFDPPFSPEVEASVCDILAGRGIGRPIPNDEPIRSRFRILAQVRSVAGNQSESR